MNIGQDKKMHFGVCAVVALFTALFLYIIGGTPIVSVFGGYIASMGAGLGKEYGDKVNPSNFWDWEDVVADVVGAISGCLVARLIMLF